LIGSAGSDGSRGNRATTPNLITTIGQDTSHRNSDLGQGVAIIS
jgi:hypothetical protein